MSARQWTREELDCVHPLRKSDDEQWQWVYRGNGGWMAACRGYDGDAGKGDWHIWIDECDTICSWFYYYPGSPGTDEDYSPPSDVALAVILAGKGLDSLEAMADAMSVEAKTEEARPVTWSNDFVGGAALGESIGRSEAYWSAYRMLRRGRVQP